MCCSVVLVLSIVNFVLTMASLLNNRSRQTGEQRVFALVEWTSGPDRGKWSHDIDVSWIRDFDSSNIDPMGYSIEWRVPPQPRDGWAVFDGRVEDISDDLDYLRRKMEEKRRPQPAVNPNNAHAPNANQVNGANQVAQQQNNDLGELLIRAINAGQNPPNVAAGRAGAGAAGGGVPAMIRALQNAANNATGTEPDRQVMRVGKSLSVPMSCYMQARAATTPTSMTMYLTRAAFSKERLQRSSYAGQKRTTADGEVVSKPGLKKYQLMRDIQDFVLTRFPNFPQAAFGGAVNACTGERARKRAEVEYEELSDEENHD